MAVDDSGGHYIHSKSSGIARSAYNEASDCVKDSHILDGMTQIDPGNNVNLSFSLFGSPKGNGKLFTFSAVLVGRSISDVTSENTLSDKDKIKQLRSFNLSIPSIEVTEIN